MHTLFQGRYQATGTTSVSSHRGHQIYCIFPRISLTHPFLYILSRLLFWKLFLTYQGQAPPTFWAPLLSSGSLLFSKLKNGQVRSSMRKGKVTYARTEFPRPSGYTPSSLALSCAPIWKHCVGALDHRPSALRSRRLQITKPLAVSEKPYMFLFLDSPSSSLIIPRLCCAQHQPGTKQGHHYSENPLAEMYKVPNDPSEMLCP